MTKKWWDSPSHGIGPSANTIREAKRRHKDEGCTASDSYSCNDCVNDKYCSHKVKENHMKGMK